LNGNVDLFIRKGYDSYDPSGTTIRTHKGVTSLV
jgi:hypothetical protein